MAAQALGLPMDHRVPINAQTNGGLVSNCFAFAFARLALLPAFRRHAGLAKSSSGGLDSRAKNKGGGATDG